MLEAHRDCLDNGLRIVTVPAPHLHSAMVAVYVGTGSRHESPDEAGVSHFLEHIFFRGCERYPDSAILNTALERVGGSLNAVTARDHGCYYATVHPSGVPLALEVTAAMLAAPLLKEIDLERRVILEEILDEVDEDGRIIDVDTLSKAVVFPGHPLGAPIAGTRQTVSRLTEAQLRAHHRRSYGAANLVVVVAGPVTPEEVLDAAGAAFAGFPRGEAARSPAPPPFPGAPVVRLVDHPESQTFLRLTFPSVPEAHPDFPALLVLHRVLDDGLASRLQRRVVEQTGLAYSVSAELEAFADAGLVEIDATVAHSKVPALLETLLGILGDLAGAPPDEDELARARARHRYGVEFMADSVADLAGWFGEGEVVHGPIDIADRVAAVDAVTGEDVRRVAARLLDRRRMVAVIVGHPPLSRTRRVLGVAGDGARR